MVGMEGLLMCQPTHRNSGKMRGAVHCHLSLWTAEGRKGNGHVSLPTGANSELNRFFCVYINDENARFHIP